MGSILNSTDIPSTSNQIVFVGAGTTALAAAIALSQQPSNTYDIHIYEKRGYEVASNVAVSGLHLKPNSTKILDAWGVNDFFNRGRVLYSTNLCRYADGKLLAGHARPVDESIGARSAETWYINRADLWTSLFDKAKELGTNFHFDVNVKTIDMEKSQLELADGSTVSYDLLIGSDGLHSRVRGMLFPGPEYEAVPSGDVIYQISIPKEVVFSLPPSDEAQALQDLYNDHAFRLYCGPHRFIVAATSEQRSKLEMQIIMNDHEKNAEGPWTREVNDRKLIESLVDGFNPSVRLAFSKAESAWRWRLGETPDLPNWASEDGKVILLGDAAHGILPFAGLVSHLSLPCALQVVLRYYVTPCRFFLSVVLAYIEPKSRPIIH